MWLQNFVQSQAHKAGVARNWARLAYSQKSGFHPPSDACKVLFAPAGVGREGVFFPFSSLPWSSAAIKEVPVPALDGGTPPRSARGATEDGE